MCLFVFGGPLKNNNNKKELQLEIHDKFYINQERKQQNCIYLPSWTAVMASVLVACVFFDCFRIFSERKVSPTDSEN